MVTTHRQAIATWLLLCCTLVYGMVVLGGYTRLSGSGLSLVTWNPIFGVLPPLTEAQWQADFLQYQQYPEYQKINQGMTLAGFQRIYLVEYAHRLLGRLLGLVFLLPLLVFMVKGWLSRALLLKLGFAFILGGLQGVLGWYMVQSGLVNDPHVSHYRLTAHLLLAVLIYAYLLWLALRLLLPQRPGAPRSLSWVSWGVVGLTLLMLTSGGLVAGLKAGLRYNTFPLMGGQWLPVDAWVQSPVWLNMLANPSLVQFEHRWLGVLTLCAICGFWWASRATQGWPRVATHALLLLAILQVCLGVMTLLWVVPLPLAALHQATGLALFTAAWVNAYGHRGTVRAAAQTSTRAAPA